MKKRLIIVLSALLAVLLSLGLVACKDKNQDNPTNKDKVVSAVAVTASPTITEKVEKAEDWDKKGFTIQVTYDDGSTQSFTDSGFTLDEKDIEAIKFGVVGSYSVKVLPTDYNTRFITGTGTVTIDHDWQPVAGQNYDECSVDKAHRIITKDINAVVNVGEYWNSTNIVTPDAKCTRIAQFPSVTLDGKTTAVATATVGRLEEGMTISVRGKGIATSDANPWYFPILGVAVPELGNGGTGMVVRNDGFLLYNYVGTGNCLGNTGRANLDTPKLSDLSDYSTWEDWAAYAEGNTSATKDYATEQDIELSWRFTTVKDAQDHEARVAELTFMNYSTGRSYIVRVKIPDSIHAVQTIFHAEYFKMTITQATVVEMYSLSDINKVEPKANGKLAYVDNEMFDFGALSVMANYLQSSEAKEVSEYDFYGTAEDVANDTAAGALDEAKWVNLKYNKIQSNFKYYRLKLTVGETSKVRYFANTSAEGNTLGLKVTPNAVNDANANTVTVSDKTFEETGLNEIEFGQGKDGTTVLPKLSISGYVATLSDEQKTALGLADADTQKHYVAFSIYQNGVIDFTNDATGTVTGTGVKGSVKVREFGDKHAVDVVLAVPAPTFDTEGVQQPLTIKITGVQDTAIIIELTLTPTTFEAESKVMSSSLYLNKEGEAVVEYTFDSKVTINTTAIAEDYQIGIGNFSKPLNVFFTEPGGRIRGEGTLPTAANAWRELGNGITATINKDDLKAGSLKVTYKITPSVTAPQSYIAHFDVLNSNDIFDYAARDVLYPSLTLDASNITNGTMANGAYVTASDMEVYFLITGTSANLASGISGTARITVNNGNGVTNLAEEYRSYDYLQDQDLSFAVGAGGVATLTNSSLPAGIASVNFFPFGTIDNPKDTDRGYAIVITVDVTRFGYESETPYSFKANNDKYMTVSDKGVATVLDATPEEKVNEFGTKTCVDPAIRYQEVKKETNVIYWEILGLTELQEHEWNTTAEADGTFKCKNCPSIKRVFTDTASGITRTLIETPAKTRVANTDLSDVWWNQGTGGSPVATHVFHGDFIVQYTFKNVRDPFWHQDVVIELINNGRFLDLNFASNNPWGAGWADANDAKVAFDGGKNGSNTMTATVDGTAVTNFDDTFKQGAEDDKGVAILGSEERWKGDYTLTIFRVGDTYTIIQKIVNTANKTYIVTNTVTIKENDKLLVGADTTVQFVGNPFWVDDIRVSYGTAETVIPATKTTGKTTVTTGDIYYKDANDKLTLMEFGKTDLSTGYTGTNPFWTMKIKPGMKVVVGGEHIGAGLENYHAILAYFTKDVNFRVDNWINGSLANGDTDNGVGGHDELLIDKHYMGLFEQNKEGAWIASDAKKSDRELNVDVWGNWKSLDATSTYATITWDWTDASKLVISYTIDGTLDDAPTRFAQEYVVHLAQGKSFEEEYDIGIGLERSWYKVDSLTVVEALPKA